MDVARLFGELTLDERAALTAGAGFWSTVAVERVGLPAVILSDGPNGVRGPHFPGTGPAAVCLPCGTAIAATWNPQLVEQAAELLGGQARDRGVGVLLAPTVNLHRSPLAGRNFECYSEDPLLAGKIAAAFVRGVQSRGVITTVKHFVGNEAEFERHTINSVIGTRALRELYLVPFEIAVREGRSAGLMTSYNRVNGEWVTMQRELLTDVLREEWGFDGFVVTDWFGVVNTHMSVWAGLNLEMPGPGRAWGPGLLENRDPAEAELVVGFLAEHLLLTFDRFGLLDRADPPGAQADTAAERETAYRVAVESAVLLTNNGLLPMPPDRRIAVIGPNALVPRIMGGGSSQVVAHRVVSVIDALSDLGVDVVYSRGCELDDSSLAVGLPGLHTADGLSVEYLDGDGDPVERQRLTEATLFHIGPPLDALAGVDWTARATGQLIPSETGRYRVTLAQAGSARVWLDDALILDGRNEPPAGQGSAFFGLLSAELEAEVELVGGRSVGLRVELAATSANFANGVRVGFHLPRHDDLMGEAVAAASTAEVAVVVVGTSEQSESETADRTTLALPGEQDDLVRRVAAANPNTVVVVNAGSVVDLPWVDDVAAVLHCWFGGQEMARAVADLLLGRAEPGGRLPTTFPLRLEHNPSYGNFPGENGEVHYAEGIFMGYRGYDHRRLPVRFPFGHGLSYTTFDWTEPMVAADGEEVTVRLRVTNTGARPGSEVVQCYVAPPPSHLQRPPQELKGFAKITLEPGESGEVLIELDRRAFAAWDPGQPDWEAVRARAGVALAVGGAAPRHRRSPGWYVDPGIYRVRLGRSSRDIVAEVDVAR